jgi:UDP-N-acetylmuramoylalanine--D-glutamate ligase
LKTILIAGGKDKGIAFDELGTRIVKYVKTLVLTGAAADQIHEAVLNAPDYNFRNSRDTLDIHRCDDFKDAVNMASKLAKDGDIVLLSPACTSFDMFKNFEERGDVFREIVMSL